VQLLLGLPACCLKPFAAPHMPCGPPVTACWAVRALNGPPGAGRALREPDALPDAAAASSCAVCSSRAHRPPVLAAGECNVPLAAACRWRLALSACAALQQLAPRAAGLTLLPWRFLALRRRAACWPRVLLLCMRWSAAADDCWLLHLASLPSAPRKNACFLLASRAHAQRIPAPAPPISPNQELKNHKGKFFFRV